MRASPAGRAGAALQRVIALAVQLDRPAVGESKPVMQVDERRLARAVRADQADDLVPVQLERHVVERVHPLERARDADGPERCLRAAGASCGWFFAVGQPLDLRDDLRDDGADDLRLVVLDLITRYCRPNTECSVGEKLTRPESVGTFLNFTS